MSYRNFDEQLLAIDGTPLLDRKIDGAGDPILDGEGKPIKNPMLLKSVIANMLVGSYKGEENLGYEDKRKRYKLAAKVQRGGTQDFTVKELALIQDMSKHVSTLAIGQLSEALERDIKVEQPAEAKVEETKEEGK